MGLAAAALSVPTAFGATEAFAKVATGASAFPSHPKWKFVVNYPFTTNPFFVPMNYGGQDAASLVNVNWQVTGSKTGQVAEQINAMNQAIAAKVDGILVTIIDPTAFNDPTDRALKAGIPVIAVNVDAPAKSGNKRLAYLGQTPYTAGLDAGKRIVDLVGKGEIAIFLNTPGISDLEDRKNGIIASIKASGKRITYKVVATGPTANVQLQRIDAYYLGHKSLKGLFAVDGSSSQGVGQVMQKYGLHAKGVSAGGFDLTPITIDAINNGHMDYTIDQQPYLMGFDGVMQLFLYKLSGGLVFPADTNTGAKFVTKDNVEPYVSTKSRFEGSSSAQQYPLSTA
jgi:simple sugar transport system substrate-binding protein